MRPLFTLLIFIGALKAIVAQDAPELQWLASEYVETINVKGPAIRKDAQGNVFSISTQTHLNPLVGFILVKYAPDGTKLWERNYQGLLPHLYYGPAIDPEGNAYVSINYGGLPGLPTYTILLKYAPDGELLWEISFEDWANNVTNLLATGPSGLLYFSGGVSNTNITQGYYVGCMDTSDGSILWKVEQSGSVNPYNMKLLEDKIVLFANGLAVPNSNTRYHVVQQFGYDGELLNTGLSEDTGFYGPDFNQITGEGDVLLGNRWLGYEATKISSEGEILWHYDKPLIYDNAFVRGLIFDDSSNTYVTGGLSQNGEWVDFLTTKLSPEGDMLWENYYYIDDDSLSGAGNNIVVDNHYAYVIGASAKDGDNNKNVFSILIIDKTSGETLYDLTVITDSSGYGEDLVLLQDGFAFCGNSNSGMSGTVKLVTGYYKFSTSLSSEEPMERTDPFLLYPNPANNTVHVQLSKRAIGENVAEVFDMNGHLLMTSSFLNKEKIKLEVGHLPAGMYVMKVGNQALKFSIAK